MRKLQERGVAGAGGNRQRRAFGRGLSGVRHRRRCRRLHGADFEAMARLHSNAAMARLEIQRRPSQGVARPGPPLHADWAVIIGPVETDANGAKTVCRDQISWRADGPSTRFDPESEKSIART